MAHGLRKRDFLDGVGDEIADFGGFVAGGAEIFVPGFGEGVDELRNGAAGDFEFGSGNFSPGVNHGAAFALLLELNPLNNGDAQSAINPANLLHRRAGDDDVLDHGFHGTQDLDKKAAADLPGPAFVPAKVAVDVGEGRPAGPIGEDVPGDFGAGLGNYGVLK